MDSTSLLGSFLMHVLVRTTRVAPHAYSSRHGGGRRRRLVLSCTQDVFCSTACSDFPEGAILGNLCIKFVVMPDNSHIGQLPHSEISVAGLLPHLRFIQALSNFGDSRTILPEMFTMTFPIKLKAGAHITLSTGGSR